MVKSVKFIFVAFGPQVSALFCVSVSLPNTLLLSTPMSQSRSVILLWKFTLEKKVLPEQRASLQNTDVTFSFELQSGNNNSYFPFSITVNQAMYLHDL